VSESEPFEHGDDGDIEDVEGEFVEVDVDGMFSWTFMRASSRSAVEVSVGVRKESEGSVVSIG